MRVRRADGREHGPGAGPHRRRQARPGRPRGRGGRHARPAEASPGRQRRRPLPRALLGAWPPAGLLQQRHRPCRSGCRSAAGALEHRDRLAAAAGAHAARGRSRTWRRRTGSTASSCRRRRRRLEVVQRGRSGPRRPARCGPWPAAPRAAADGAWASAWRRPSRWRSRGRASRSRSRSAVAVGVGVLVFFGFGVAVALGLGLASGRGGRRARLVRVRRRRRCRQHDGRDHRQHEPGRRARRPAPPRRGAAAARRRPRRSCRGAVEAAASAPRRPCGGSAARRSVAGSFSVRSSASTNSALGPAVGRLLGQSAFQHRVNRAVTARGAASDGGRHRVLDVRAGLGGEVLGLERARAGQQLVGDDGERVAVRGGGGGLAHRLLGREVGGGAEHLPGRGQLVLPGERGRCRSRRPRAGRARRAAGCRA